MAIDEHSHYTTPREHPNAHAVAHAENVGMRVMQCPGKQYTCKSEWRLRNIADTQYAFVRVVSITIIFNSRTLVPRCARRLVGRCASPTPARAVFNIQVLNTLKERLSYIESECSSAVQDSLLQWRIIFCSTECFSAVHGSIRQWRILFCSTECSSAIQNSLLQWRIVSCNTEFFSAVHNYLL